MKGRNIGTVTLPRRAARGLELFPWCQDVNTALQQLRDRMIDVKGRPSVSPNALPLTITNGSAVDKFRIYPGYVNAQMPTLAGTALNNATPPEITVSSDVWVYVKCVGTFGSPDTYVITIHTEASATLPTEAISATAFTSYFYIGWIDFTAGSPATYDFTNDHSGGNLGIESFGSINLWWKK